MGGGVGGAGGGLIKDAKLQEQHDTSHMSPVKYLGQVGEEPQSHSNSDDAVVQVSHRRREM